MNARAQTGKIVALAGSGSAEYETEFTDPVRATRVYPAPSQGAPTEAGDVPQPRVLPESGPSGAPSKVGRYVVLDVLGMGGMGVVCTAYDPKLDRKVALKLLRRRVGRTSSKSSTGRARLVREAQALAKLSHPNIVTVHDVDTTEDGRIYMAMEFVRGRTITQWLFSEKPHWREILSIFEHAGTGLAAAHQANITHRDFKPANVLIGEDGRVKVLDFGLAKSETGPLSTDSDDARSEPGSGEDIMQVVQSTGDMKLTMAGRIVGTPAYMAPEQRRGRTTGPATDQFSFAVALYEALYGRLPFRSESHSRDAARGRVIDPPNDTEVPSWVFRALKRAFAPQPSDRYRTMEELLAALRADPARRLRRLLLWTAGVVGVGGAGAGALMALAPDDELCRSARDRLGGVWDPGRRAVVDASLRDTATAYAAYTADRVLEDIDAYADRWAAARTTVCEATWVHREQSESTLDVRMACLDQRRGELRALVNVLADADGDVVERAVSAVTALTSPVSCVSAEPGAASQLPADPEARSAVLAAQAQTDDAEALLRAGRYSVAQEVVREAVSFAAATHHAPTVARTTYVQGRVTQMLGDYEAAGERFREAAEGAAAVGDPALEARALTAYVGVAGVHLHDPDRALGIAVGAKLALLRAGTPPELESRLALQLGGSALQAREVADAVEHLHKALEAAERAYPPGDIRFADLRVTLGIALAQQGNFVEAEGFFRRALDLRESEQGPMHPDLAFVAHNLANVLASTPAGLAEAIELADRAMKIRRAVLGPETKAVADLWMTKARLHKQAGEPERALTEYARAADIYRKRGADVDLGDALTNLTNLHIANEAFHDAQRDAREALSMFKGSSMRAIRGRARASLRLCISSRRLDPGSLAVGDGPIEHCTDAVARMQEADLSTPELYRALEELALALEARGNREEALRIARKALTVAKTDKDRRDAIELLDRLVP
ncbi:MAG: protein kinase domain-containing protein [Nannocystales bacterium]